MGLSRHYTDAQVTGMTPDTVFKIDRLCDFLGYAPEWIDGYRDPAHNLQIGGVADSAHCKGMAVDLRAPVDPFQREKFAWAAGAAGFRRVESCPRHYHVDTDDATKPSPDYFPGTDH